MNHPLAKIPPEKRPLTFILLLAATLAIMAALNTIGPPLNPDLTPMGIVSYEFAATPANAQAMIDDWDLAGRAATGFNLGLDYLFMVAYSTTIGLGIMWAADALKMGGRMRTGATLLAWGQWLAALLDAIENAALLTMLLDGQAAAPWPQLAMWMAAPKFILVLAGILFVLAGAVIRRMK